MRVEDLIKNLVDPNSVFTKILTYSLEEIRESEVQGSPTQELEDWMISLLNHSRQENLQPGDLITALSNLASGTEYDDYQILKCIESSSKNNETDIKIYFQDLEGLIQKLCTLLSAKLEDQESEEENKSSYNGQEDETNTVSTIEHGPNGSVSRTETTTTTFKKTTNNTSSDINDNYNSGEKSSQRSNKWSDRKLTFGNKSLEKSGGSLEKYKELDSSFNLQKNDFDDSISFGGENETQNHNNNNTANIQVTETTKIKKSVSKKVYDRDGNLIEEKSENNFGSNRGNITNSKILDSNQDDTLDNLNAESLLKSELNTYASNNNSNKNVENFHSKKITKKTFRSKASDDIDDKKAENEVIEAIKTEIEVEPSYEKIEQKSTTIITKEISHNRMSSKTIEQKDQIQIEIDKEINHKPVKEYRIGVEANTIAKAVDKKDYDKDQVDQALNQALEDAIREKKRKEIERREKLRLLEEEEDRMNEGGNTEITTTKTVEIYEEILDDEGNVIERRLIDPEEEERIKAENKMAKQLIVEAEEEQRTITLRKQQHEQKMLEERKLKAQKQQEQDEEDDEYRIMQTEQYQEITQNHSSEIEHQNSMNIVAEERQDYEVKRTLLDTTMSRMERIMSPNRIYQGSETTPERYSIGTDVFTQSSSPSRRSIIMRADTIQAENEDDVKLRKSGYLEVSSNLIEKQALHRRGQAYHPRPPQEVQNFKVIDETQARHSDFISEMPSSYIRVHKPHKNEMYVIDGHKKYPDGHIEPAKIQREDFRNSPYNELTVQHKIANPVPVEKCDYYQVDGVEVVRRLMQNSMGRDSTYSPLKTQISDKKPTFTTRKARRQFVDEFYRKIDLENYKNTSFIEEEERGSLKDMRISQLKGRSPSKRMLYTQTDQKVENLSRGGSRGSQRGDVTRVRLSSQDSNLRKEEREREVNTAYERFEGYQPKKHSFNSKQSNRSEERSLNSNRDVRIEENRQYRVPSITQNPSQRSGKINISGRVVTTTTSSTRNESLIKSPISQTGYNVERTTMVTQTPLSTDKERYSPIVTSSSRYQVPSAPTDSPNYRVVGRGGEVIEGGRQTRTPTRSKVIINRDGLQSTLPREGQQFVQTSVLNTSPDYRGNGFIQQNVVHQPRFVEVNQPVIRSPVEVTTTTTTNNIGVAPVLVHRQPHQDVVTTERVQINSDSRRVVPVANVYQNPRIIDNHSNTMTTTRTNTHYSPVTQVVTQPVNTRTTVVNPVVYTEPVATRTAVYTEPAVYNEKVVYNQPVTSTTKRTTTNNYREPVVREIYEDRHYNHSPIGTSALRTTTTTSHVNRGGNNRTPSTKNGSASKGGGITGFFNNIMGGNNKNKSPSGSHGRSTTKTTTTQQKVINKVSKPVQQKVQREVIKRSVKNSLF